MSVHVHIYLHCSGEGVDSELLKRTFPKPAMTLIVNQYYFYRSIVVVVPLLSFHCHRRSIVKLFSSIGSGSPGTAPSWEALPQGLGTASSWDAPPTPQGLGTASSWDPQSEGPPPLGPQPGSPACLWGSWRSLI